MANNLVEPLAATAPTPEVTPTAPQPQPQSQAESGPSLPEELIQIPAIQGMIAGQPPAFSVTIADFEKLPEGKTIVANKDSLMQAGMGFYRSLGGDLGAIFNRMYLSDTEIQEADKAGQLQQVAPPLAEVNQMLSQSGAGHPVLQEGAPRPTGFKSSGAPAPTPGPVAPMQPMQPAQAKTPARVMQAKMRNLNVGSPTEGQKPGAGRILNSILKPVL